MWGMTPKEVRLAGSILDPSRHVCAFFNTKEEEYGVLTPFIKEGFDEGDRDLARFGATVVMDILRTHPMVIIGGILQQNPFFVPPDEFLNELRERMQRNPRK